MQRYATVLRLFWTTSLAASMEYRLNFLTAACSSLLGLSGNLFALFLFYRHGYRFAGWRWEEALIVVGLFTFMNGFVAVLLTPNLSRLVRHVERGTLDFILLKPVDSQFWVSTRTLSPWGFPDCLLGIGLVVFAGYRLGLHPSVYIIALLPIGFAVMSVYALWFMLASTCIWFVKIYNATEVLKGLLEAGRFPIAAFPPAYRVFFTFVVPVAFITTVPAETLLARSTPAWIVGSGITALALLAAARALWRFALRYYTSASS